MAAGGGALECKTFEMKAQGRVYLFEAETPADMAAWIAAVDQGMTYAKAVLDNAAKARDVAATPYRIRVREGTGRGGGLCVCWWFVFIGFVWCDNKRCHY